MVFTSIFLDHISLPPDFASRFVKSLALVLVCASTLPKNFKGSGPGEGVKMKYMLMLQMMLMGPMSKPDEPKMRMNLWAWGA